MVLRAGYKHFYKSQVSEAVRILPTINNCSNISEGFHQQLSQQKGNIVSLSTKEIGQLFFCYLYIPCCPTVILSGDFSRSFIQTQGSSHPAYHTTSNL